MKAPASSSEAWRAPYEKARRAMVRTERRLQRAERIIALRDRFLAGYYLLYRRIDSPELVRILRGHAPADAGFRQVYRAFREAHDELRRTHECTRNAPDPAVTDRVADGLSVLEDLSRRAKAVRGSLRSLAFIHANLNAYHGVVLPPPVPETLRQRLRRLAAAARSIPPRCRRRRRPPRQTIVIQRVTRGRAPPAPLHTLSTSDAVHDRPPGRPGKGEALMSTPKNLAVGEAALASPLENAQSMLDTIATMRAGIPAFAFQIPPGGRQSVSNLSNVPFEFMEQSNTAMRGEPVLQRGGVDPDELRKLFAYGSAHGPVADALEFLAKEMRESVDSAMSKSGNEALTTYQLAARYAKRPEYAHLKPVVQLMRRTLGRFRKSKPAAEEPAPSPQPQPQPSSSELSIQ